MSDFTNCLDGCGAPSFVTAAGPEAWPTVFLTTVASVGTNASCEDVAFDVPPTKAADFGVAKVLSALSKEAEQPPSKATTTIAAICLALVSVNSRRGPLKERKF
jgi:hypothetical protein